MEDLKFELKQRVRIVAAGEHVIKRADVIARAEYLNSEPQYLLRYVDAEGQPVEVWWTENALEDAEPA